MPASLLINYQFTSPKSPKSCRKCGKPFTSNSRVRKYCDDHSYQLIAAKKVILNLK